MNRWARLAAVAAILLVTFASGAHAESVEHLEWSHRGKTLSLAIYRPTGVQRGTILMAGGDVGWVGLAVTMAHHLVAQGYLVAGINVRQYLSAYTVGSSHLSPADIQRDYADLSRYLNARGLLK